MMAEDKWLKAHIMVGVKTNVITGAEVTDGYTSDSPRFPDLVVRTAETFQTERISATKPTPSARTL